MAGLENSMRDADQIARDALKQSGVSRWFFNRLRTEMVAALIIIAVGIGCYGKYRAGDDKSVAAILVAAPATLAFVLGYLQWRAGTHEASFEQYYARLKDANALFSAYQVEKIKGETLPEAVKHQTSGETVAGHLQTMFNFAELDNIEYILSKLRLGYVRQGLATRAVRAFVFRCLEDRDGFRSGMMTWVGTTDLDGRAGYDKPTRILVRYIVEKTGGQYPWAGVKTWLVRNLPPLKCHRI